MSLKIGCSSQITQSILWIYLDAAINEVSSLFIPSLRNLIPLNLYLTSLDLLFHLLFISALIRFATEHKLVGNHAD